MNLKYIVVNPEIAAKSLQNNEGDLYIFWLVARNLDYTGKGIIKLSDLINACKNIFSINSNWVYTKISNGINKYWRKPFGKKGDKSLALIGIGNIIKRLEPNITRTKPIKIPVSYFNNSSSKFLREFLVSVVASRYEDYRPISILTISNNTGMSESAVRNAIKSSHILKIANNFKIISSDSDANKLLSLVNNNVEKYKIVLNDGIYSLLQQIPNSYYLNEFERLPLSTRPKELKKIDKKLLANLEPIKYHNTKNGLLVDTKKVYSRYLS